MTGDIEEGDLISLTLAVKESDIDNVKEPKKELSLVINTEGGCAYECLAMCEYLESLRDNGYFITTIGQAKVISAGVPIWLMGNKRIYGKTTVFGLHSIQSSVDGDLDHIVREVNFIKRLNQEYFKVITRYSDINHSFLKTLLKRNTLYFLLGEEWGDLISGKTKDFKDYELSDTEGLS